MSDNGIQQDAGTSLCAGTSDFQGSYFHFEDMQRAIALGAALSAVLAMGVGTGGRANASLVASVGTGFNTQRDVVATRQVEVTAYPPLSQQIILLRRYLSLNITQLASVLNVERPTIYAWSADKATPQPANVRRISDIYQIAQAWRDLSSRPLGKELVRPLSSGKTLLDYLSSEHLDHQIVASSLRAIHSAARPKQRESISNLRKKFGFDPPSATTRETA